MSEKNHGHWICYLLINQPRTRTYLGITNNTEHRLRQHNGELAGGAKATRAGRPWSHALIVSGFVDHSQAAKFEWRWRHEGRTRRLNGLDGRRKVLEDLLNIQDFSQLSMEDRQECF